MIYGTSHTSLFSLIMELWALLNKNGPVSKSVSLTLAFIFISLLVWSGQNGFNYNHKHTHVLMET
jgi:hypothetical protein